MIHVLNDRRQFVNYRISVIDTMAPAGHFGDMAETLTELPAEFAAGTTVIYHRTLTDYPASEYTMTLYLAGANVLEVAAVADGDLHVITIDPALTEIDFSPGHYLWAERVDDGSGNIYEVASGRVKITPNLAEAGEGDFQEWVEEAVTLLKAHIKGRLPAGLESYSIAGRAVSKIPITDALKLLDALEARLSRLHDPSKPTKSIYVQFAKPGTET
jgi:hypothetical protein